MRAIKLRKLVGVEIRMVGGGGGSTFNSYLQSTIYVDVSSLNINSTM